MAVTAAVFCYARRTVSGLVAMGYNGIGSIDVHNIIKAERGGRRISYFWHTIQLDVLAICCLSKDFDSVIDKFVLKGEDGYRKTGAVV